MAWIEPIAADPDSRYDSAMQCNIDARGKAVRLIYGLLMLVGAAVVAGLVLGQVLVGWGWWVAVGALAAAGALGVFEARAGWCAVRAMGIKTPM